MVFLFLLPLLYAGSYANILVSSTDYPDPDVVINGVTSIIWQQGKMRSEDIDYSSHKTFWVWASDKTRDIKIHLESLDRNILEVGAYSSTPKVDVSNTNDIEMPVCEEAMESFTIMFNCITDGSALVNVTISDPDSFVAFDFLKTCSIGVRDDLSIKVGNELVVEQGKVKPNWLLPMNVIDGDVDIEISVQKGIQILKPVQYEGTGIKIRGPGATGAFLSTEPTTFKLLNECKEAGLALVKFDIPYYDSITLGWQHACLNLTDTNPDLKLTIGTTAQDSDIISNNELNIEYQHGKVIDTDIYVTNFYIAASQEIQIPPPILTANKQILHPKFELYSTNLGSEPALFKLNYRCIDDGASEVKVTIPLGVSHVEFTLVKLCKRPQVRVERGGLTANGLFLGIGCAACLITLGLMLYSRKKTRIEGVSTV